MGQAALFERRIDDPSPQRTGEDRGSAEGYLFYQLLECIQDAVAVTDWDEENRSPRIIHCNAAFTSLLSRLSGGSQDDRQVRRSADPLRKAICRGHSCEGAFTSRISAHGQDGARIILQFRSEPARIDSRRNAFRIAVFHDVTQQMLMDESFRRNERLASIGLLGAGIAHEISNPAGSALLAAETALAIKDQPGVKDQFDACLNNIVTSMDRCGRIVRSLLRYSRQEPTEKQACNINDVVTQTMEQVRAYEISHGAKFQVSLSDKLTLVPMNPLEIELVLLNLIRNAVEAGNKKVIISIHTTRIKNGVRVIVADNGRGMNEEQLAHVFDPLYTTRWHSGGSGVGMSIAKGIIRAHKGRMEVRSRLGKGTTVIFDLPIADNIFSN